MSSDKVIIKIAVISAAVFLVFLTNGVSQTRKELEEKRAEALRDIEITNLILEKTKNTRSKSLNELIILRRKIGRRNSLIRDLNGEIDLINNKIAENQLILNSLETDLIKVKKEYESIIKASYKRSEQYDNFLYILASEDLGQAYKRIKYYQQYVNYRKKQARKINAIEEILTVKENELLKERRKMMELLNSRRKEKRKLNNEEREKNSMVIELQGKERRLRSDIEDAVRISQQLEAEIRKMIAEERRRREGNMRLTPEEADIDINFGNNKGKLPWPTERGVIIEKYGEHKHPVLKNVKINNNGIDIVTVDNSKVRSIFDGEVRKIIAIKGANSSILIKHGNYFSVYQNLININVRKGDKVNRKQVIGEVYSDNTGKNKNIVHLEIWRNNEKMNPEEWIAK